jgi:hypothetical protein
MNETLVYLLKESGSALKDIGLVVFTYIVATKQAINSKKAEVRLEYDGKKEEIRLEQESDERERIEEYHRQFPVVMNEMRANSAILRAISSTLDNLSEDSKITRKRLDHLAEIDDEMRQSNERRFLHLEQTLAETKICAENKFDSLKKQVQGMSQAIGELDVRIAKNPRPKPKCPSNHFIPPLSDPGETPAHSPDSSPPE